MITLQRPDPKVSALIGENKGIHNGDVVRPSIFAIPFVLGKRKVVLNTLTGHCVETKEYTLFENPKELTYDDNDDEMRALVAYDYLVARDFDEVKKYTDMLLLLRRIEKKKAGYTGYTILPTTACNARCAYCYELGMKYETMSDEIAEQTIHYIRETRCKDANIRLTWYGGEPLMKEDIIDRICRGLRDANIEYSSSMISNGSLMTEEMATKAKEDWHLNSIQVTLDGREDVYCERKRYIAFEGSPYRAVLKGIHAMLDQKIHVSIRLNVDEENLEELMKLADELETEFDSDSGISVYCHSIFTEIDDDTDIDIDKLYGGMERLNKRLEKFKTNSFTEDEESEKSDSNYYDRQGKLKRYYCLVDSPASGPVILPGGELTLCSRIDEFPTVGTVFDETPVDREPFVKRDRAKREKCSRCGLLPVCTDFSACPTINRDCYRETLAKEKQKLISLEEEKRLPPINMSIKGRIIRVIEPEQSFLDANRELITPSYIKPEETMDSITAEKMLFE